MHLAGKWPRSFPDLLTRAPAADGRTWCLPWLQRVATAGRGQQTSNSRLAFFYFSKISQFIANPTTARPVFFTRIVVFVFCSQQAAFVCAKKNPVRKIALVWRPARCWILKGMLGNRRGGHFYVKRPWDQKILSVWILRSSAVGFKKTGVRFFCWASRKLFVFHLSNCGQITFAVRVVEITWIYWFFLFSLYVWAPLFFCSQNYLRFGVPTSIGDTAKRIIEYFEIVFETNLRKVLLPVWCSEEVDIQMRHSPSSPKMWSPVRMRAAVDEKFRGAQSQVEAHARSFQSGNLWTANATASWHARSMLYSWQLLSWT